MNTEDTGLDDELSTHKDIPADVRQIYQENWDSIQTYSNVTEALRTHTIFDPPSPLNPHTDWETELNSIFTSTIYGFKINYSHHFILRHQDTNKIRFDCENLWKGSGIVYIKLYSILRHLMMMLRHLLPLLSMCHGTWCWWHKSVTSLHHDT